jgi:DNA polymerase I-like protein with 3'-5' exonuclease and polymerase domains
MKPSSISFFRLGLTENQKNQLNNISRIYNPDMKFPIYNYKQEGRRILIVSDKIIPGDEDYFLEGRERGVVDKLLDHCFSKLDKKVDIEKIAFLPFEAARPEVTERKNSDDKRRLSECYQVFMTRLKYFIDKFKPDCVICCGPDPFTLMFRELVDSDPKRVVKHRFNRLFKVKLKDHKFQLMGCIDLARPISWDTKNKDFANLLGYLTDGWIQAFNGYNWYTVTLENTAYRYVNTIEKFKSFYKKLLKADIVAIDTEGSGDGRLTSKLYSAQFAFTKDKGYFVPIDHPDTPFSSKELAYIKSKLKYYFEFERCKRYHIYQYGKYDVGQFYAQLGIRFYNHRIYDIMGGQFCWNENIQKLKAYGVKGPYALDMTAAQFGCYVYEEIEFSKGDRGKITKEGLTKRLIQYGIVDVVVMIGIHDEQIKRAIKDKHKRFLLYNCEQISDTLIALAQMENVGAPVDRKQIYYLKSKDGPINKSIEAKLAEFKNSKAAQNVNKFLTKKQGLPQTGGMFGNKQWLFDINTQDHQDLLFYTALKLKPLSNKKDGRGKVDKAFLQEYSKTCPEVALFKDYKAACTLRNNFVNKMFTKLHEDKDTMYDGCLRSSYTYTKATTGRLTSINLNLQNLVSRGDWAPHLKRAFIAPRRCAVVASDFSANEVRDWCNQSGDEVLRKSFYAGLALRQKLQILLLENPDNWTAWLKYQKDKNWFDKDDPKKDHESHWTIETKKSGKSEYDQKVKLVSGINDPITNEIGKAALELELKGDLHKQNCVIMYSLKSTLDVNGDQRYDIKAITFGRIYGKISISYAKPKSEGGLGKTEEECEQITTNFDNTFKKGTDWLSEQHELGKQNIGVESPLGMFRHLDGYLHTRPAIINAMNRRGPNSMIQGTSSHVGVTAIRSLQKIFWHYWVKHEIEVYWKTVNNYVHDALYSICPISFLPVYLYLKYHAMTTLVHRRFSKLFGYNFRVGLEGETNIGGAQSECKDVWNFDLDSMLYMVDKTIKFQKEQLGYEYSEKEIRSMISDVKHNWKIISKLRLEELKESVKSEKANTVMLLTEHNARTLGLRIEGHDGVVRTIG